MATTTEATLDTGLQLRNHGEIKVYNYGDKWLELRREKWLQLRKSKNKGAALLFATPSLGYFLRLWDLMLSLVKYSPRSFGIGSLALGAFFLQIRR